MDALRTRSLRALATPGRRRDRRGVEAVEFAITLPIFLLLMFSILEYGWYMFQQNGVHDAARIACQVAGQFGIDDGSVGPMVTSRISDEISSQAGAGIDCSRGIYSCDFTFTDLTAATPPRYICAVEVNYVSLTGADGFISPLMPDRVKGLAVSILEEAN